MRKGEIKEKITADYILDLYDKAKSLRDKNKKLKLMKVIKTLSQHVGEYIIKPLD